MLTLLEKIYGAREDDGKRIFSKFLTSFTSGLYAEAKFVNKNARNWIQIEVSGSDAKVAKNYIRKRFGFASSFVDLHVPMVLKGKIVDSDRVGYGLYVDIGLFPSSSSDVLIPLHRLRSHLAYGKKLSLRKLKDIFCLHDNFPLSIRLTDLNPEEQKMLGEPSDKQIKLFREWLTTVLDRVIILGVHYEQVMLALERAGIKRDIAKVEELGFLENCLLCKLGTDAPGVIKALGRHLPKIPIYAFSPRKINNILAS